MAPTNAPRGVTRWRSTSVASSSLVDEIYVKAEPEDEGEDGVVPQAQGDNQVAARQVATQAPTPNEAKSLYTIFVGEEERKLPQSKFLDSVWGNGLDSACHTCGREFEFTPGNENSICRTIQLASSQTIQQEDKITHPGFDVCTFRIIDRHLGCVDQHEPPVSISLQFHASVAMAKDSGLGNPFDREAARLVHHTIADTLKALAEYRDFCDPEILHDYLSIALWHPKMGRFCHKPFSPGRYFPPIALHWYDVPSASLAALCESGDASPSRFYNGLLSSLNDDPFSGDPIAKQAAKTYQMAKSTLFNLESWWRLPEKSRTLHAALHYLGFEPD
ncbi:hypothetical protein B0T24DRAFT_718531 [Lasiosphaeria ovina]|uniref:Uncharacterized protein n=1 Tax=Lasiosphaeria ovina TaxID=92902 RepID=A0AAE0KGG2_9PEZI|nr:hypothetical protein B0T24DRAFT_718531 [Lasiosphaeria ovina]